MSVFINLRTLLSKTKKVFKYWIIFRKSNFCHKYGNAFWIVKQQEKMFYFESKVQPALGTYSLLVLVFWNLFLNFPCNFTFTNTRKRNSTVFITPESCVKRKKKSEFNIHLRTGKNIFVSLDIVKKGIPFIGWTCQDPTSNTFGHIIL